MLWRESHRIFEEAHLSIVKEMSEWRRIVIDSRYKTCDSISSADFYVELPYATTVPADSLAYIDNVSLSHSWPTIQPNGEDDAATT